MIRKKPAIILSILVLFSTVVVSLPAAAHEATTGEQPSLRSTNREASKAQFDQKRLAICEKRQATINRILTDGSNRAKRHLGVIQKIEEKVEAFYTKKGITVDGYDAAVANANQKEAAAVAAIEPASVSFDCQTADVNRPGEAIKQNVQTRHQALKDYRTAVKDLILVVKKANGQHREDSSTKNTEER